MKTLRHVVSFTALTLYLINGTAGFANPIAAPATTGPATVTPATQRSLDLSSVSLSAAPSQLLSNGPVTIQVGGAQKTVTTSTQLTAAERVAVYQVAKTGQQSIVIGAQGAATGGMLTIGTQFAGHLSGLVVPANVTVIDRANVLNLSGNLNNSGNLFAVGAGATNVAVNAANIFNNVGAVLSNIAPSSLALTGLPASLNLALTAQHVINNAGTIASSGNLSLTAGSAINNTLTSSALAASVAPAMRAAANLNLMAPQINNMGSTVSQVGTLSATTSALVNSGVMQSIAGAFNIQGLPNSKLSIDNTMGRLMAKDVLSISTVGTCTGSSAQTALTVRNGVLSGSAINFSSPGSFIDVSVDRLDGCVNASGYGAAIAASGGNLNVSSLRFQGDPIISLRGGGTLTLNDFDSAGTATDFIALSEGSIDAAAGTSLIATHGGLLTLSAGYQFQTSGASAPDPCTTCSGNYTLSSTRTGYVGDISLDGVSLNASGDAGSAGTAGGNMLIQAAGNVRTGSINTNGGSSSGVTVGGIGSAGANAGNVNIKAGGSITTGAISAIGGNGGGGQSYTYNGSSNGGAGGNGGSIDLAAGQSLFTGDVRLGGGSGGSAGDSGYSYIYYYNSVFGNGGAGGNAGASLNVTAGGTVTIGSISGSGGIGGSGGYTQSSPFYRPYFARSSGGTGGAGGSGADLSIQANGTVTVGDVTTNGGAGGVGSSRSNYYGGYYSSIGAGSGGAGGTAGSIDISGGLLALGSVSAAGGRGGDSGYLGWQPYYPFIDRNRGNGGAGGDGNSISLISSGAVNVRSVSTAGGNGGNVACCSRSFWNVGGDGGSAGTVSVSGQSNVAVGSLDAGAGIGGSNSYPWLSGSAGSSNSVQLSAGSSSAAASLQLNGPVNAQSGMFLASGTITVASSVITEGNIQFASRVPGNGSVTVVNNGLIQSNSGIVAFNGGPSSSVTLSGTGSVYGAQYIAFGNLDPVTLNAINGVDVAPTSSFASGLVSASQGSTMQNIKVGPAVIQPVSPAAAVLNQVTASVVSPSSPVLSVPDLSGLQFQINSSALVPTDKTPISPVAFVEPTQPQGKDFVAAGASEHLVMRINDQFDSVFLVEDGADLRGTEGGASVMTLSKGQVLCAPNRDTEIQTSCGTVSIKKAAVAVIVAKGDNVSVYNLADKSSNGVTVTSGEDSLSLSPPGTQLTMTRTVNAALHEINPRADVAVRNARPGSLGDGVKVFLCDFSMLSAMNQFRSLTQLRNSGDVREHQLSEVVLRNAAIRTLVARSTMPFQPQSNAAASE